MLCQFPPERIRVALQGDCSQPLVFDSDVVEVAVGAMVDREVQAQLGLPTVPEAAQNAVSREVVEEPVELKVRIDAGRDVVLLRRLPKLLDRLSQPGPLGSAQRFESEFPGVRLDKQPDRGDLSDVPGAHLHDERPAEGDLHDQALLLEPGQCLAKGGPADAEIRRDVPLAQLSTRRDGPVENRCPQHPVHTLGGRRPLQPSELGVIPPPFVVVCRPYRVPRLALGF